METFDGNEFSIGLPKDVENTNAVVSEKGTIIYNEGDSVSIAVQAIQEKQDGLTIAFYGLQRPRFRFGAAALRSKTAAL